MFSEGLLGISGPQAICARNQYDDSGWYTDPCRWLIQVSAQSDQEGEFGDMENISVDQAQEYGVTAKHNRMDNGELRYRIVATDGSSYVRVEATEDSGWQNSHYHNAVLETYIIQKEWAALVELDNGEAVYRIMQPGDVYTTRPGISHNVYLPAHAVIHVVKHGDTAAGDDWHSDEILDSRTKCVSEEQIPHRT